MFVEGTSDQEVQTFEELQQMIPKGARVRLIMQPKLWFISGKCGISLRVLQVQVKPSGGGQLHGFAFSDTGPEATTEEEVAPGEEASATESGDIETPAGETSSAADVEDDVGEDVEEDEEEEELVEED